MDDELKLNELTGALSDLDYPLSREAAADACEGVTLLLADGTEALADVIRDSGADRFDVSLLMAPTSNSHALVSAGETAYLAASRNNLPTSHNAPSRPACATVPGSPWRRRPVRSGAW